jgi:hypothetical protein
MNQENDISRRKFVGQSALFGASVTLAGASGLFASEGRVVWQRVKNKEARYRYVIDAATI